MRDVVQKNRRVLIFDDNIELLELCTVILERIGCKIKTSTSSINIEKLVSDFQPDIIFMDNWLPETSGIEATRILKSNKNLQKIPVIYFSANNNVCSLAKEAGADDYLAKPFDITALEMIVKKYAE